MNQKTRLFILGLFLITNGILGYRESFYFLNTILGAAKGICSFAFISVGVYLVLKTIWDK